MGRIAASARPRARLLRTDLGKPAMKRIIFVGLLLALAGAAHADPLQDEIAHLIDFVRHSSCTFIRNGTDYDGGEAADHVQAKYDYYKDEIKTVEDFIE